MAPLSKRPSQLEKPLPAASSSEEEGETKNKPETKRRSLHPKKKKKKSSSDQPAPQEPQVVVVSSKPTKSERVTKKLKKKAEEEEERVTKKLKKKAEEEEERVTKKLKKKAEEEEERVTKKLKKKAEEEEERVTKKLKKKAEEEKKKPILFQRLWSEADELVILKGIADYYAKNGADPVSDVNAFLDFIKKSLQFKQASEAQLADKMKRLKNRYLRNAGRKGKNGGERTFSNPHERDLYNLSKIVWANEANNSRRLRTLPPRTQPMPAVVAPLIPEHPPPPGHDYVTYDQFQQGMLETRTILEALLTVHFSPEQVAEIMARARTGHA